MNKIKQFANMMIKKYHTRSPFDICKQMGVKTIICDLPINVNGMSVKFFENYVIIINSNLESKKYNQICAHELAHILLHDLDNSIQINNLSPVSTAKIDAEANDFSFYLLYSDDSMRNYNFYDTIVKNLSLPQNSFSSS